MTAPAPDEQPVQPVLAVGLQPQPLPAQWTVVPADPPNRFVVVIVDDASGRRILFLEPDAAVSVADDLVKASRQARSGLVIPQNGHLPDGLGGAR